MAGHPDYDRLVSTTLEKYIPRFEDNVFTSKPFLYALTSFGNVETLDGGTEIVQPLMYAELRNQGSYDGADTFLTEEDDGFTAARYDWKHYYGVIRLKNIDLAKNSGAPAVLKIVENEAKRAEMSISEALDEMFLSDGSGNGGKDMLGMKKIVSATETLGGIDPTATGNDFWQSSVTGSVGAVTNFNQLRNKYLAVSEGNDFPTNIFTTETLYAHFDSFFTANQRFMDPTMANQGFETIMFHGAPISFDRNVDSGYVYLINFKYVTLYKLGSRWFSMGNWVEPINQDIRLKKIILSGQLTCSNRKRQGLLTGVTTA
jgi:hypothetical protein